MCVCVVHAQLGPTVDCYAVSCTGPYCTLCLVRLTVHGNGKPETTTAVHRTHLYCCMGTEITTIAEGPKSLPLRDWLTTHARQTVLCDVFSSFGCTG